MAQLTDKQPMAERKILGIPGVATESEIIYRAEAEPVNGAPKLRRKS